MYGLVLVEAVENILVAFEKRHIGLIILTIILAFFFLLSAFETLLDFKIASKKVDRKSIRSIFVRYLIWFVQFIPFILIISTIPKFGETNHFKSIISASIASIYMVYAAINALKIKIFIHYLFLSSILWIYFLLNDFDDQLIFLNIAILFVAFMYIKRWWKPYFKKHLFGTN